MVTIKPPELDAQYAILGSILIDPEITGAVIQRVHESDFTDATCKHIFTGIKALYVEGSHIDAVVVLHRIGEEYRDYLAQLMEITPTSAGWQNYADIMREQAQLYRVHSLGAMLESSPTAADAKELISKLNEEMSDKSRRVVSISDGFQMFLESQSQQPDYLEFGFDALDDGRLFAAKGDFIVLGARPSVGKTALAIQMARHMGQANKVGFFSLETGAEKFYDRYVSNSTGTSFGRIKNRDLDETDWPDINVKMHKDMKQVQLDMIDASGMSVDDIRAMTLARRYDIIFVDYLQLISGRERDAYSRVTQISMGLHNLAQQAHVAVIALAQLRRSERVTDRKTKKTVEYAPTLSDLRESGQIEQDADIVFLMYLSDPDNRGSARILRVAKNKEGRCGSIRLLFDGGRQRFDCEPEEEPPKIGQQIETPKIEKVEQMQMNGMPANRRAWGIV